MTSETACAELVRRYDRDRYRAALFAPQRSRKHLLGLYAFNVELSRISERVSEPALGEISLQWWRDALRAARGGETTGHPVADALGRARHSCVLPDDILDAMIDARLDDLDALPHAERVALDRYLAHTAGALFLLGSYVLGARDETAVALARAGGVAYGLSGVMRSLPYQAARGRIVLPGDALAHAGLDPLMLCRGEGGAALETVLAPLRHEAAQALHACTIGFARLKPRARPAFLPLALVGSQLRALARPAHDPLRDIVTANPLSAFARMWRANLSGRL
jgi:phytoene synthase